MQTSTLRCPINMSVIEEATVASVEEATAAPRPPLGDTLVDEISTPRKIVRAVFIAAETASIFLVLLLYLPHPVDWTSSALPAIALLLLPFASVAMLLARFWVGGFSGLITTAAAFFLILSSGFGRLC